MFETWRDEAIGGFDPALGDAARLERIRRLEEMKAAVAAAQALEVAAYVRSRREAALADIAANPKPGVSTRRRVAQAERGTARDVAWARRESPAQASRFIAFAQSAREDLPKAFAALSTGALSERRALLLHRATAWLAPEQRREVDATLAPDLAELGDRSLENRARAEAYRIDPEGAHGRLAAAENERRVTLRPAPESMTWLTALLPMAQGVATFAALDRAAGSARAVGDVRGRGQVMADTLVELVTGQSSAAAVPIEVHLVMTDRTLLGGADDPVHVIGGGVLPGRRGRELVVADDDAQRSIRRLFTDPLGRLVTMETDKRSFTRAMRHFVTVRDEGTCRTPWCDAPIRHIDHVVPAGRGGPTSLANARGLCERCNYAAQAPGPPRAGPPPGDPPRIDLVWFPGAARAA